MRRPKSLLLYIAAAGLILWLAPIPLRKGWVDGAESCFMTIRVFGAVVSRGGCRAIWIDGVRYENVGGGVYQAENGDEIRRR